MRLDKYLKLTRLIKRRGVAKVLIDEESITVNNKSVKPSYDVKINDLITMKLGQRTLEVEVISLPENNITKETAKELFRIKKEKIDK